MTLRVLPLLVLAPSLASAATYNLVRDYSGETFFDGWNFFGGGTSHFCFTFTVATGLTIHASGCTKQRRRVVSPSPPRT